MSRFSRTRLKHQIMNVAKNILIFFFSEKIRLDILDNAHFSAAQDILKYFLFHFFSARKKKKA